jgi:hypothetical protein
MGYEFLDKENIIGLQFYNLEEFNAIGVVYTAVSHDIDQDGDCIIYVTWSESGKRDGANVLFDSLIVGLNAGVYVISSPFDTEEVFSELYNLN